MNELVARRVVPVGCLLGSLGLWGCAASGGAGMATTLEPGQRLGIVARGGNPVVRLTSEGPGSVALLREGSPPVEFTLGSRGVTELASPGGGTFSVVNRSTEKAAVDVRVSGSQNVEIKGPVVPPPGK